MGCDGVLSPHIQQVRVLLTSTFKIVHRSIALLISMLICLVSHSEKMSPSSSVFGCEPSNLTVHSNHMVYVLHYDWLQIK